MPSRPPLTYTKRVRFAPRLLERHYPTMHELVDQLLAAIQRGRRWPGAGSWRRAAPRRRRPGRRCSSSPTARRPARSAAAASRPRSSAGLWHSLARRAGPRSSRFQLDDDYGWDDGLICGGRMKILVDPLDAGAAATTTAACANWSRPARAAPRRSSSTPSRAACRPRPLPVRRRRSAAVAHLARSRRRRRDAVRERPAAAGRAAAAHRPRSGVAYLPVLPRVPAADRRRRARRPGGRRSWRPRSISTSGCSTTAQEYASAERFPRASAASSATSAQCCRTLRDHAATRTA